MNKYKIPENCKCGKVHKHNIDEIIIESGAIRKIPGIIKKYNCKKPFVFGDSNTFKAAGEKVCEALKNSGMGYTQFIFNFESIKPDEKSVGSVVMHFDATCDIIIAVGSGVINDIGKIISKITGKKYVIVATAPSVDGYASSTSSMDMDSYKLSLPTRCPDVIIGDIDVLKNAPLHMLKSGVGDMLAKYVGLAEWRIANIITGEYYCQEVSSLVKIALEKCVGNASGLLRRDENAVKAVFEGLIISGLAMTYADNSRPASGIEHYYSHIWDMRGLEFGTPTELHGIQCAMGTYEAAKKYEKLYNIVPDKKKALEFVENCDYALWQQTLREFVGKGAEAMIENEKTEQKFTPENHAKRLCKIIENWDLILQIAKQEMPSSAYIEEIARKIDLNLDLMQIGIDEEKAELTFKATKDIRNKYILSNLCWDLGIWETDN